MKRIFILLLVSLSLFSCKKDLESPGTETITSGSKWNLRIGSNAASVYASLQQLGTDKRFSDVAVVGQQAFATPEALGNRLQFYHIISIETTAGVLDRTLIELGQDKVGEVQVGGARPASVPKWPSDVPDEIAIHPNDPLNTLYDKLVAIYKYPQYQNRKIGLSDKPLNKPYDPAMANYNEWAFTFFVDAKTPGKSGRSTVRLVFKNGKLNQIRHTYEEFDLYY